MEIVKLILHTIRQLMTEEPQFRNILKKKVITFEKQIDTSWINDELISFVKDRLGHDRRYAIDSSKIQTELGWYPDTKFEDGIVKTVRWYLEHQGWVETIVKGDYMNYYEHMYSNR